MLFQKESPHWLIGQGRDEQAQQILRRLRGPDDDIDAETEEVRRLRERESGYRELLSPQIRPALLVGIALAVFQQITGVNTVIYYAPTLLQSAGLGSSAAILAEVCVGGINVLLTIVAVWLMDRVGRRPLLLEGPQPAEDRGGTSLGARRLTCSQSVSGSPSHSTLMSAGPLSVRRPRHDGVRR